MGMAETDNWADHHGVAQDPGCYEVRFRLTGLYAFQISFGLVLIAVGIFQHQRLLSERVIIAALGGLIVLRYVIPLLSRKVLFRADPTGVMLGSLAWLGLSSSTVFIPWADIEKIALYKITRWTRRSGRTGSYMVIVPRGAHGRGGRIDAWRLDPERLTAVAAAAAPGVPVVDAGDVDPAVDADMKRLRAVFEQQPG